MSREFLGKQSKRCALYLIKIHEIIISQKLYIVFVVIVFRVFVAALDWR